MSNSKDKTWIFFYGTFMSAEVLCQHRIECERTFPAKLNGYELSISPRVNLEKKENCTVYGGLAFISHQDISRLYEGLKNDFGITYFPYPVLAELEDGSLKTALCYVSSDIKEAKANPNYVNELAKCAKALNARENYIQHIKSFA